MTYSHLAPRWIARFHLVLTCAAIPLAVGCSERENIRSYTVAKETKKETKAEAAAATDRMLAAIVPAGGQAWFFKVVGPVAEVDKRADEIDKFFTSIRAAEGQRAQWELPAGWREEAGGQMRAATIHIPADGKPLEMSVSTLPWSGTEDDVLRNVNRWRTQMQLPEVGPTELRQSTRELQAGDAKITVADLKGRFQGGPMMGPFAGGGLPPASTPPASDSAIGAGGELPTEHPPIDVVNGGVGDAAGNAAPLAADAPKFEAPASWQPLAVQPGGMRKAAFGVAEGEKQALVTVISFPGTEGPMIADPLLNVNRWRREVGMSEIQKEELASSVESMEIDGESAHYVKLIPDAAQLEQSQAKLGTLAVMVTHGGRIWFIKMQGSRDLVAAQEDQFKSFLKSIRFPADS